MRVLVTGATGFIGNYVINNLLKEGVRVVASSRSIETAKNKDWFGKVDYVPWIIGDSDNDDPMSLFGNPDLCIHLAWDGLPDFKKEEHTTTYFQNHFQFLKNLIEGGISKVLVTGTCLEYGMKEGELRETDEVVPELSYAVGKDKLRKELEQLRKNHRFDFDWVRLFYMHGKGQSAKSILAQLEKHVQEKLPVFNMSGGEQVRDYLPVEEVAEIIVKLALIKKSNGIVNCASGNPIKIVDLVTRFLKSKNAEIKLNLGYYPYPDYEPFKFWGSTEKLNSILKSSE